MKKLALVLALLVMIAGCQMPPIQTNDYIVELDSWYSVAFVRPHLRFVSNDPANIRVKKLDDVTYLVSIPSRQNPGEVIRYLKTVDGIVACSLDHGLQPEKK